MGLTPFRFYKHYDVLPTTLSFCRIQGNTRQRSSPLLPDSERY
jgi:hypothetical protein